MVSSKLNPSYVYLRTVGELFEYMKAGREKYRTDLCYKLRKAVANEFELDYILEKYADLWCELALWDVTEKHYLPVYSDLTSLFDKLGVDYRDLADLEFHLIHGELCPSSALQRTFRIANGKTEAECVALTDEALRDLSWDVTLHVQGDDTAFSELHGIAVDLLCKKYPNTPVCVGFYDYPSWMRGGKHRVNKRYAVYDTEAAELIQFGNVFDDPRNFEAQEGRYK